MEQVKIKNSKNETLKAGCIVLNDQNEVLLVSLTNSDMWSFPKGHMEDGEDMRETAVRETMDETGYKVEIVKRLPDIVYKIEAKNELVRVMVFLSKPIAKGVSLEKGIKSSWFSIEKAKQILYPNLVSVLDNL